MRTDSCTMVLHRPSKLLCTRLLVTLLLMVASGCVWGGTRTDVITRDVLTGSSSAYQAWTSSGSASTAVYAGNTTGGTGAVLKLKPSDNSGIVSTTSGGRLKSITVVWYGTSTTVGATLEVYGKKAGSSYGAPSDLYKSSKGTRIGELVNVAGESSATLPVSAEYAYVGLRAKEKSNVLFFDEIRIEWESDDYADLSGKTATQTAFIDGLDAHAVLLGEEFAAPTAVVTATGTETAVEVALLTYTSSAPSVATVDEATGAVTVLTVGTTLITATYAGDDTYEGSTASYTLTVTPFGEFTWDATQQGYADKQRLTTVTAADAPVQLVFESDADGTHPSYDSSTKKGVSFYVKNRLTVSAPEGYAVSGISFTFTDTYNYTFTPNVGSFATEASVGTWTGISPYVILTNTTGVVANFSTIVVSYTRLSEVGEVTVKSVGVATFCPVGKTVVVGDGTPTYIYTGLEDNGTTLKESALPVVPAGTGVMIGGTSGEETTYKLYGSDLLTATAPGTNLLVGVTEDNTPVPANSYVLQNGVVGLAFYYVDVTGRVVVGAGKAYLKGDEHLAKAAFFFRGGAEPDPVGISTPLIEATVEGIYNLQGIRQATLQHGVNIIRLSNGKTIKHILP